MMCARLSLVMILLAAMTMDHSHRFEPTPDGGVIVMEREVDDPAAVMRIRRHIKEIARLFTAGDFRLPPGFDRPQEVPGRRVRTDRGSQVKETAHPLLRGAKDGISSRDPKAVEGIQ